MERIVANTTYIFHDGSRTTMNGSNSSIYRGLVAIKKDWKENGHSDQLVYMLGSAGSSANPYKHWIWQVIFLKNIQILYKIFRKKLRKKTLKKQEENSYFSRPYIFS